MNKLKQLLRFERLIYLDYNATTYVSKKVRKTMRRALRYYWGNPSSGYRIGKISAQVIEKARQHVANAIGAHSHEVYFTGCATESNNAVIKTLSRHFYPKKKKIISTPIEHSSVKNALKSLQEEGIDVQYCEVDSKGRVSINQLEKMIDEDTFLICCVFANNEIGTIQNIKEIAGLAKSRGILTLSDCVQALGKVPVNVKEFGVDYATFSAHKLYGPKGIGALYAKITSPLKPFIHGGHQEEGIRAGTESIHNIVGFGEACKDIDKLLSYSQQMKSQKEKCIKALKEIKPDVVINSSIDDCLPNTISVTFPGINGRELMSMLDYHGIAVSAGSACSTQSAKASHVLKAIGLSDEAARETLRISFGVHTKNSHIDYLITKLSDYIKSKR